MEGWRHGGKSKLALVNFSKSCLSQGIRQVLAKAERQPLEELFLNPGMLPNEECFRLFKLICKTKAETFPSHFHSPFFMTEVLSSWHDWKCIDISTRNPTISCKHLVLQLPSPSEVMRNGQFHGCLVVQTWLLVGLSEQAHRVTKSSSE